LLGRPILMHARSKSLMSDHAICLLLQPALRELTRKPLTYNRIYWL
jgi:hypothetical protein